ncbi:MAG: HEAT repeat domain-containing protein, partial [Verrucomicrobiae bacterium]|nr:HEAT repeat domain-containing protein [Verrucomicrobiae bacterium]
LGTERSLAALAELLRHEETVGIACLALNSRRSAKVAQLLRDALPASKGRARLQIISAIGNQRDKLAVRALGELARHSDCGVANEAIIALGKIGGPEAQRLIAALRKEGRPGTAIAVAEATLRIAEQTRSVALYEELLAPSYPAQIRRGAFAALLRLDRDGGEKRILDVLRRGDPLLEPVAIAAVGNLKSASASAKFAAELVNLVPHQQAWMIEALATRGDAAARNAIRNAIWSPNAVVRLAAFRALGNLNDAASVPLLCAALGQVATAEERQEIVFALGQISGAAADEVIFAELQRASGDARRELIALAARRGNRAAIPLLLDETGSADLATAKAAFQALGRIAGADDLPLLLAKLLEAKATEVREAAEHAIRRAMARIADPARRLATLKAALAKASDCEARCALLRLMPFCGCAEALVVVTNALKDNDARIREAGLRALTNWPDLAAWESLVGICREPEKESFRALALRGLVRLAEAGNARPDARLIERYRQLMGIARDDAERKLVLGAVAAVAHPDVLPLVYPLLEQAGLRAEAAQAVNRIAAAIKTTHPEAYREAARRLKAAGKLP